MKVGANADGIIIFGSFKESMSCMFEFGLIHSWGSKKKKKDIKTCLNLVSTNLIFI
jgi:hypothetical protein